MSVSDVATTRKGHCAGFSPSSATSTSFNRHYDIDNFPHPRPLTPPDRARVKDHHRRKIDIAALVTEVVVNPKATPPLIAEVAALVKSAGYTIPVRESGLARYAALLPF